MFSTLPWHVLTFLLLSYALSFGSQRVDKSGPDITFLKYYVDEEELEIQEIRDRHFRNYDPEIRLELKRQTSLWVQFQLKNPTESDFDGFLHYPVWDPQDQLFSLSLYDDRLNLVARGGLMGA